MNEQFTVVEFEQLEDDQDFNSGKELTVLVRRLLETEKRVAAVEVLNAKQLETEAGGKPSEWLAEGGSMPWSALNQVSKSRFVIFGTVIFHGDSYIGFVNETVEDPNTGRPVRRTVRRQLTTYKYKITICLADLVNQEVPLKESYDRVETLETKLSIHDFYSILEPKLAEFISQIAGKKRIEKRRLLQ